MEIVFNIVLSAVAISVVLWISKTNPVLAGFVGSLPLSTLIVLAFSKLQDRDVGDTQLLAKSIFIGIPATLLFFIPFLVAERLKLSFWTTYFSGFALLSVSYFIHRYLVGFFFK
jgi:uncharacterized membrane protein (GlpM family)